MPKNTKKPAPAPTKKAASQPADKPAPKQSPTKPVKSSKPSPKKPDLPAAKAKPAAPAAVKPVAKPVKPVPAPAPSVPKSSAAKPPVKSGGGKKLADLRSSILAKRTAPARPISFSLDEIREIARTTVKTESDAKAATVKTESKSSKQIDAEKLAKAAQPNHIKAASLADILGFNPKKARQPDADDDSQIPEKFRRYHKLLIDLRNHLTGQIDTHSEETLKRSSKDDAGDLSSYGQHMADAGTDTFDRDFALSLVSSEQEALSEVEAAIKRVKDGTYGICEITQKPIAKERLLAVPFTRYSAEAQKDIEKNRHRSRTQAGLFGELGEEGGTISNGGDDGGDD